MSGGGGGGGGGFGPPDPGTNCQRLSFRTAVASPQPQAVAAITVGEELDVVLRPGGGGVPPAVEVRRRNGTVVGGLIDRVTELLRCLQQGFSFIAEVLSVSGGAVRVEVRPA
jgi:hypothetical protein